MKLETIKANDDLEFKAKPISQANDEIGTKQSQRCNLNKAKPTIDLEFKAKPISQANDEIGIKQSQPQIWNLKQSQFHKPR
jgi:hypothetical protein